MGGLKIKLNLGCGYDIKKGYLNYDRDVDLEKKLPFKSNSTKVIVLKSVLEHINNREQLISECYRVLKMGGLFYVRVPYIRSWTVGADLTHKLGFTFDAFERLSGFKIIDRDYDMWRWFKFVPKKLAYFIGLYTGIGMINNIDVIMVKIPLG